MEEYSENTKQIIGELVLQIHDLEEKLAALRREGDALVAPLRAIADLLDPKRQDKINLVLARNDFFATTHSIRRHREQISMEGKSYPAFSYPGDLKTLLLDIFETEQGLRQLEKALHHAKHRAHKV